MSVRLPFSCEYRHLTNASRGTSNAWHFYYALILVITVLCGNLVVALSAP
ncbi:DUF3265 domain-containing protein [Vibrio sp. V09_P4A23P171]|uniref:DUF3265 domain-containing protein n=1 Tax=Vibrio qinghaiensis TaxID=2025808 RepID=A0A223N3N6_9VIBR|nr:MULTISPECIES: DUF3265 domain-containing protein [Vibrio]NAX18636.1 DUF3265 domain-containing protein [Vibrio sp. V22_P2S10T140]PSD42819.1 DUF3265 domain-containing protein [Vibrio sp. V02_P2A34T13]ASU24522.1 DUF3265 domain-containing protein [Vibrio qinghaiensis]ASU24525.1 DUF3265 domain-containing protein [Vibrio qinghaiensis]OXX33986.1 DUF3265 domain-containing protein [Vibrio sp. V09_P4A23P171]